MDEFGYQNIMRTLINYSSSDTTIRSCIYCAYQCITPNNNNPNLLHYQSVYNEFNTWATGYNAIGPSMLIDELKDTILLYNTYKFPSRHLAQCMLKAFTNKCAKLLTPTASKEIQLNALYIFTNHINTIIDDINNINTPTNTIALSVYTSPEI